MSDMADIGVLRTPKTLRDKVKCPNRRWTMEEFA